MKGNDYENGQMNSKNILVMVPTVLKVDVKIKGEGKIKSDSEILSGATGWLNITHGNGKDRGNGLSMLNRNLLQENQMDEESHLFKR